MRTFDGADRMSTTARDEVCALVRDMPEARAEALLRVLRRLRSSGQARHWTELVGTISAEDAELMRQAIEEEFERIEAGDW
ncbi:MAG: hypothetical protein KKI08_23670 [Armatimonadetes bacterium]|nr:hypothetical protein [Armatimonadota bacterium]